MGGAKKMMMMQEGRLAAAVGYLVSKGYLQECPIHGQIYDDGHNDLREDESIDLALEDHSRGDGGPVPWAAEMDDREFIDLLKRACEENAADECGWCAKNRHE